MPYIQINIITFHPGFWGFGVLGFWGADWCADCLRQRHPQLLAAASVKIQPHAADPPGRWEAEGEGGRSVEGVMAE